MKKDSTVCVKVRENYYEMIASSYSNIQMSFEDFCCLQRLLSRGMLHITCQQHNREKLWDLHVAAEREMPQINY